jgi:hypothetical protein
MHPALAKSKAFTLIELLIVFMLVGFGSLMLSSGVGHARPNVRAMRCLGNLKRMSEGWRMYADDNSEKVVNNFGLVQIDSDVIAGINRNWANNIIDWSLNQRNTNVALLTSGVMAPYIGGNVELYKCPSDNYLSAQQRAAHWKARTRSISMNAFFGAYSANTNDVWASGRNSFYSSYRQWLKVTEVGDAQNTWVLMDEQADSINDGLLLNNPGAISGAWSDIPASYHEGGCSISFSDGRAENHRWLSQTTRIPVQFNYNPPALDTLGRTDYQWLMARTAALY